MPCGCTNRVGFLPPPPTIVSVLPSSSQPFSSFKFTENKTPTPSFPPMKKTSLPLPPTPPPTKQPISSFTNTNKLKSQKKRLHMFDIVQLLPPVYHF